MGKLKTKNALDKTMYDDFLSGFNHKGLGGHSGPIFKRNNDR